MDDKSFELLLQNIIKSPEEWRLVKDRSPEKDHPRAVCNKRLEIIISYQLEMWILFKRSYHITYATYEFDRSYAKTTLKQRTMLKEPVDRLLENLNYKMKNEFLEGNLIKKLSHEKNTPN